jgi:hypothetical protein
VLRFKLLMDLVDGLAYLHSCDMVHVNVSPDSGVLSRALDAEC